MSLATLEKWLTQTFTVISVAQVAVGGTKRMVEQETTQATGVKGYLDVDASDLSDTALGQQGSIMRKLFLGATPVLQQNYRVKDESTNDVYTVLSAFKYRDGHQEARVLKNVST